MTIRKDLFFCPECGRDCNGSLWYRNHEGIWETKINCKECESGFVIQDLEDLFKEEEL